MKNYILTLVSFLVATLSLAGTSTSGGTPPSIARELESTFAGGSTGGGTPPSVAEGTADIFRDFDGKIRLTANRPLGPSVSLSASEVEIEGQILRVKPEHIHLLSETPAQEILGENGLGGTLYYKPVPGDTVDVLKLIERRAAARAAVSK